MTPQKRSGTPNPRKSRAKPKAPKIELSAPQKVLKTKFESKLTDTNMRALETTIKEPITPKKEESSVIRFPVAPKPKPKAKAKPKNKKPTLPPVTREHFISIRIPVLTRLSEKDRKNLLTLIEQKLHLQPEQSEYFLKSNPSLATTYRFLRPYILMKKIKKPYSIQAKTEADLFFELWHGELLHAIIDEVIGEFERGTEFDVEDEEYLVAWVLKERLWIDGTSKDLDRIVKGLIERYVDLKPLEIFQELGIERLGGVEALYRKK